MSKSEHNRAAWPRGLAPEPNVIDGNLMDGEGNISDRAFKLMKLQRLGVVDKRHDFLKLRAEPNAFNLIERAALDEAKSSFTGKGFMVRHVSGSDPRLHEVWYEGDPEVCWDPFKAPGYTAKINKDCGTHEETVTLRDGEKAVILRPDGTIAHLDGREIRQDAEANAPRHQAGQRAPSGTDIEKNYTPPSEADRNRTIWGC